ncbi:MAG: 3'-5' exonuclease, partial [Bacteroidota bacterium]
LIKILDELRDITSEHSSSEMLNLLLERLDLRRIIVAWGNGEQRMSNIDELRRLAVAYEDNCHRQHRAASLGGYLLYLDGLLRADRDAQGASERETAVNILTYHRSKGLEWPAVITMDLEQPLRADVWGVSVASEVDSVDLSHPLAGRWLKYWVNPYGKLKTGLPWIEALQESDWQREATENALGEEARLLYVGFTRARDYLILPTTKNGAPWLDRAYARGGGVVPVLSPDTTDAPFDWDGHEVTKFMQHWQEPRNLPASPMPEDPIAFLTGPRPGRREHPHRYPTDAWRLAQKPARKISQRLCYYEVPLPDPATDEKLLSQAIAHFLYGQPSSMDKALRHERAQDLLATYLPGGQVDPQDLERQALAFSAWVSKTYPGSVLQRGTYLRYQRGHKEWVLRPDWIIERSDQEVVIIMDVHQRGKQFDQQTTLHLANLALTQDAVEALSSKVVRQAWLHLPILGLLCLAETPIPEQQMTLFP